MFEISPLAYAVSSSIEVQRLGAAEKERELRRADALEKIIADEDDALEHQVESTEEIQPISDEDNHENQNPKRKVGNHASPDETDDQTPHIDLTA